MTDSVNLFISTFSLRTFKSTMSMCPLPVFCVYTIKRPAVITFRRYRFTSWRHRIDSSAAGRVNVNYQEGRKSRSGNNVETITDRRCMTEGYSREKEIIVSKNCESQSTQGRFNGAETRCHPPLFAGMWNGGCLRRQLSAVSLDVASLWLAGT